MPQPTYRRELREVGDPRRAAARRPVDPRDWRSPDPGVEDEVTGARNGDDRGRR